MNSQIKRAVMLAVWCLAILWAAAAWAGQYSLDQQQQVYLPGSTLPSYLLEGGTTYQGGLPQLMAQSGQASGSQALAASTQWWYFSSGHYDVLMPGTSAGPYASYYYFALSLSDYLGESYGAATRVLGQENNGYGNIDLWLTATSDNAVGWYNPGIGSNSIYLNLSSGSSSAFYGGVAAHETTHLILDHDANLYRRDPIGSNWYTEALAYYVGNSVYAYGNQYGYYYNSALLKQYSQNGAQSSSWYDSGARYIQGGYSNLDWVQLNVIGYFLANSNLGWSAIQNTVSNLIRNQGLEASLQSAYGMASGMYSTATGVNNLYSNYIYYYLGHN